jgi:hypothetical protein
MEILLQNIQTVVAAVLILISSIILFFVTLRIVKWIKGADDYEEYKRQKWQAKKDGTWDDRYSAGYDEWRRGRHN